MCSLSAAWNGFWERDTSKEEIQKIIAGDDLRKKKQLFKKIQLNSSHYLLDLQLFSREDLHLLIEEYRLPEFNYDHAFRRKNAAEVFVLDKELKIEELKWTDSIEEFSQENA